MYWLMSLTLVPRIIQSPKTITFLVIPFLVLRNIATWAYIKSTFSEESFTTSAVLPSVWGSVNLFRDCPAFCSSTFFYPCRCCFFNMIILPWNSIACNFSNSLCTCSGITAKANPLFLPFFQIGKSTRQFSCKYVVALKPKSLKKVLFRFLIMVTVLLFTDFLILSIYNMMLRLVVILLIRLPFEDDVFIWLVDIFLRRIMKWCVVFGGLFNGRFSRTAVWVSIKVFIIISSLERSSFCKNSMVKFRVPWIEQHCIVDNH